MSNLSTRLEWINPRWLTRRLPTNFIIWVIGSLLASLIISVYPYLGLAVTALVGIAFGIKLYRDSESFLKTKEHIEPQKSHGFKSAVGRQVWLLDAAAILLLIFPSGWMLYGLILVLISWVLRGWTRGHPIPQTPLNVPILALSIMIPVSVWASGDPPVTLVPLGQFIAGVSAFYAIADRVRQKQDVFWAVAVLFSLGILLVLVAPVAVSWSQKYLTLPDALLDLRGVVEQAANPNIFAGALLPIFLLSAAVLLHASFDFRFAVIRILARALLGVATLAMFLVLVLTQSRGATTVALAGILFLLLLRTLWVLVPVLGGVGFAAFAPRTEVQLLLDFFFKDDSIPGLVSREELWTRAIYAMQHVPFTGIGLWTLRLGVPVWYPNLETGDIRHAHNLFLQIGVDLGIPGLVAFIALLVLGGAVAFQHFRRARRYSRHDLAAVALGLFVALVAVVLHGLVDVALWDTKPAVIFWMLLAMVAVVWRTQKMDSEPIV